MTRFVLKLALSLALLLTLVIGTIRAQRADDSAVHQMLSPHGGCTLTCALDIHPGKTTREEALELLKAHPWVLQVKQNEFIVGWTWSGQQPEVIDAQKVAWLTFDRRTQTVERVHVPTRIAMGTIWLALGVPHSGGLTTDTLFGPSVLHRAIYRPRFELLFQVACTLHPHPFWSTPVLAVFTYPVTKGELPPYVPPRWNSCVSRAG